MKLQNAFVAAWFILFKKVMVLFDYKYRIETKLDIENAVYVMVFFRYVNLWPI